MPDQLGLDERLARSRTDLLDAIEQPPLERIGDRAAALRRRRLGVRAAGALCAVMIAAVLVVRPGAGGSATNPPVAGQPSGNAVYTDAGITINGLADIARTLDVPGEIVDVEFTDSDHGYLVATCGTGPACAASFARTTDGGLTWAARELPTPAGGSVPDLVAFPNGRLVLAERGVLYTSADSGRTWQRAPQRDARRPARAEPGQLLRLRSGGADCRGGAVEVWTPEYGYRGDLLRQPGIDVCWVAATATADGAWWAGGVHDGRAALAVSRDGGASWRAVPLNVSGGAIASTQVAVLGSHAYAVVLGPQRTIRAIFHSGDGGLSFAPTRQGGTGEPATLAGDAVPLLDGRLLVTTTDNRWYVSADDGRTFLRAEGNLPAVARLARTSGGYVAYNLFGGGWAAFSSDGSTWRKLWAH